MYRPPAKINDPWYQTPPMVYDVRLSTLLSSVQPQNNNCTCADEINLTLYFSQTRQSQLRREQLSEALTQGIRQEGMMAYADPVFRSGESQAYAASYVPSAQPPLRSKYVTDIALVWMIQTRSKVGRRYRLA